METEYDYTCPNCSKVCSVPQSMTGQDVVCPSCSQEFFATPPELPGSTPTPPPLSTEFPPHVALPEKLPFFKSGRRKILAEKYDQLICAGELNETIEKELDYLIISLG